MQFHYRHHPLWDDNNNTHLFTAQATRSAEQLIELLATYDLTMLLSKEIPTLQHMVTKRYSRPDNVFCTERLQELIVRCEVDPSLHLTSTNHFSIVMKLLIPQEHVVNLPSFNFREADWDSFRCALRTKLNTILNTMVITNEDQNDPRNYPKKYPQNKT